MIEQLTKQQHLNMRLIINNNQHSAADNEYFDTRIWEQTTYADNLLTSITNRNLAVSDPEAISLANYRAAAFMRWLKGDINDTILLLETAQLQYPSHSILLNDLAAAYFTRGQQLHYLPDLIYALKQVDLALKQDEQLLPVHYNRAIILQNIFLLSTARSAWEQYLQLEQQTEWRACAQAEINKIDKQLLGIAWPQEQLISASLQGDQGKVQAIVSQFPQDARTYAFEKLLPGWAEDCLKNCGEQATQALKVSADIGNVLANLKQDNSVKDSVSIAMASINLPVQQNRLVEAYKTFIDGKILIDKKNIPSALIKLRKAQKIFHELGDAANEAYILLALTHWEKDYQQVTTDLATFKTVIESRQYPYLMGRYWRRLGSSQGYQLKSSLALDSMNNALHYLELAGDVEGQAMLHFIIADILNQIKEKEDIWQHQYATLSQLNNVVQPQDRVLILSGLATQFQELREAELALYFHNESSKTMEQNRDSVGAVFALIRRSLTHYSLGNLVEANTDLAKAKMQIQLLNSREVQAIFSKEISIMEGDYKLKSEPQHAIKLFTKLISSYDKIQERFYLTHLYKSRAYAYIAIGDLQQAERDLNICLDEFEHQRAQLSNESYRIDFFEDPQTIYGDMINLQLIQNKDQEAFKYAERAKARALLDKFPKQDILADYQAISQPIDNSTAQPITLKDIQLQLPADHKLIEYVSLKDRLVIWLIERNKIELIESPITSVELNKLVHSYLWFARI